MKGVTGITCGLIALILFILVCICVAIVFIFGLLFSIRDPGPGNVDLSFGFPTEIASTPAPTIELIRPEPGITPTPISETTIRTLEDTFVPVSDLRELAIRLEGKSDIPETVGPPVAPLQIGETETFWVSNLDQNSSFQIDANLQYVTDHVYFWIEDGVSYNENDLRDLVETFENEVYPTNREFFGSEWNPGVDGDPHIYILYARRLGSSILGYYSSADQYHPLAHEYSNGHEMFFISADNARLRNMLGVLAHEFQHMIHWYGDRNEQTWMNEGFSEVSTLINDLDPGGFDFSYTRDPDIQLTDWPQDGNTAPHYGAAFLYLTYFLDKYGEEATRALVADPENGLASVDSILAQFGATDPLRGTIPTADDLFQDWTLALYLQDSSVGDGRYVYYNYSGAPTNNETETIRTCNEGSETQYDVSQYGVDYLQFTCDGDFTLRFEGSTQTKVVPRDPHSGDFAFWSNRGDESDMTLTQLFDFTDHAGPLTLEYWTWYDIERDFDYLYLETSLDGETWTIIETPSGTADDPTGNSYGWGYNGLSGGAGIWVNEMVDLSAFAGQEVFLRFEYVTDAAVNGEGFLLDEVSIPEIGYETGFETDNGGWEAAGWVRIENILPQSFRVSLVTNGAETLVEYLTLDETNTLEIPISIGGDVDDVTLVISGTTRFTRERAGYQISILP